MAADLQKRVKEKILILDGSTGTMLQQQGMPAGVSPEQYCIEHPQVIQSIQRQYLEAGSDIIYAATFGANRVKLANFGLQDQTTVINTQLAELAAQVAHPSDKWVAGSIGPTGVFFEPFGEKGFEQGIEIFTEQIKGLVAGGVDFLVIETQIDIQEARIALIAAKECCDLPVIVSMTFDESGRTLTGSDPLSCLTIIQSLGAAGFGVNCSTGPDKMLAIIQGLSDYSSIPLMVKPNAGLPEMVNGESVFPMEAEEFCQFARPFYEAGVTIMGGCCGTTPEHIAQLSRQVIGVVPQTLPAGDKKNKLLLASTRKTLIMSPRAQRPIQVIGERINPTGKQALQNELKQGKMNLLKQLAAEQAEQGAAILDVNVGMAGIEEKTIMCQAVADLAVVSDCPLCIDSSHADVLEAAIRYYPGRVLLNSLSGEDKKLKQVLPIIKKYGPAFITLPLHDQGIPETLAERKTVLDKIIRTCQEAGVNDRDAVVDGLVLTVSSDQRHAQTTLETIAYAGQELGLNTVVGLSNVSFGLPGRSHLNSAFLAMAAGHGLSLVIANPSADLLMDTLAAANVLVGRDQGSQAFIQRFARSQPVIRTRPSAPLQPEEQVYQLVIQGERETVLDPIRQLLDKGLTAFEIVDKLMVPAIEQVGEKYNKREYFLPQLIASAETMEKGVAFLAPYMHQTQRQKKGIGVIATVQGDIHDIGKKIVALMLRNNGYEVIDLGKSIDEETIIDRAIELQADFIGLSALMTTTMTEMPKIIKLAQAKNLKAKIIVGGAVVTPNYAKEIEADGYAVDAGQAVDVINRLVITEKK